MTSAASLGRDSDTVGTLAGAPGFEPGITGPKPVALPLGHAPVNRDAECTRTRGRPGGGGSPPVEEEHGQRDRGQSDDGHEREQAGEHDSDGDENHDQLGDGREPRCRSHAG